MPLACTSGCTQLDRHLSGCPCADPQHEHGTYVVTAEQIPGYGPDWPAAVEGLEVTCGCTGCLPKLAASRLAVCPGCERTARGGLAELPDLWVDLAERPRLAGVSKAPTSEGDTPDPMSDARRQERSAIKAMLVAWCLTLADDYAITVPDEAGIAATTRRIAAWHSDQARHARDAANLLDMPTAGPLHRDQLGATALRRQAAEMAEQARAVRDDRETGRDILRAICEHITRHVDRLLAGEHAEQLVSDLKAAMKARGMAYAAAPDRLTVPCPSCGTRNRASLDPAGDIRCKHCGDKGDARWWGANAEHEPMNLGRLRDYLGTEGLYPTERQLRSWADKGKLETTRPGRASDGKMQDRLFDPIKSVHVVAELLSHKRHERSVA